MYFLGAARPSLDDPLRSARSPAYCEALSSDTILSNRGTTGMSSRSCETCDWRVRTMGVEVEEEAMAEEDEGSSCDSCS